MASAKPVGVSEAGRKTGPALTMASGPNTMRRRGGAVFDYIDFFRI
jgi:hypothetical protein